MNVLADMHHHDLYYSLQLLFEKRLGWNLYRPLGIEWHNEGYWAYSHQGDTVKQFLGLDQAYKPPDGTPVLNKVADIQDGVYLIQDTVHGGFEKAVTLKKFKEMKFDIIIASVPQHVESFKKLIAECQSDAKLVFQVGNEWHGAHAYANNIMASAKLPQMPSDINWIEYHQEFDLNVYSYKPPITKRIIKSFINCLPHLFPKDYAVFNKLKELLPEFEFKSYGGSCDDGSLHYSAQIAQEMQQTMFGFHCKEHGDGYGHVLHNWFAVGRPVITRGSDYQGKLAGDLLIDGETCIDIEKHSIEEVAQIIQDWSDPVIHKEKCGNVYKRFNKVVNFDKEEIEIRKFLENLR